VVTALRATGAHVETEAGDLQAELVVLHLDGELATTAAELLPRMTGDTHVIALLPRTNLSAVVDIMRSSERVAGLLVADELDPGELTAMAARVLAGDIFGLEKLVPSSTAVHIEIVGDYHEKSRCIAVISEFAEQMGVRRKYRDAIAQCLDEMLMNALYDAPVDEHGQQLFAGTPTKTRISLRLDQKVVVQYAYDGARFTVSVRDVFGTLERATVLSYLHKCLHAEQQIDRKAGGAGLGLYLMVSSASAVYFHVLAGVATEAVCMFDLKRTKQQLGSFGFFTEKTDASEPPRTVIKALAVAIVAVLALIAAAVWRRG
jgi:hypothetical protein